MVSSAVTQKSTPIYVAFKFWSPVLHLEITIALTRTFRFVWTNEKNAPLTMDNQMLSGGSWIRYCQFVHGKKNTYKANLEEIGWDFFSDTSSYELFHRVRCSAPPEKLWIGISTQSMYHGMQDLFWFDWPNLNLGRNGCTQTVSHSETPILQCRPRWVLIRRSVAFKSVEPSLKLFFNDVVHCLKYYWHFYRKKFSIEIKFVISNQITFKISTTRRPYY